MSDGNRVVYLLSLVIGVLSVLLGVVLAYTWQGVYREVKTVEQAVLAAIPGISSGGIQIVAMTGLGLFLAWAVLFTLDWRKRIQGKLLLGGSALTLVVLGLLGILLPHVAEHPIQNTAAFLTVFILGLISEVLPIPLIRSGFGDLFDVEPRESSLWPVRLVTTDKGGEAEFPVATGGLLLLILAVLVGANVTVLLGDSLLLVIATVVVSVLYALVLFKLIGYDLTRGDLSVDIIGPTGSGKTLFFYGLDDAIRNYEDKCENYRTNGAWSDKIHDIETADDKWPTESTDEYSTYAFEFLYGKLHRKVKMVLHDFPGEDFDDIRGDIALPDGGPQRQDPDTDTGEPSWADPDDDTDRSTSTVTGDTDDGDSTRSDKGEQSTERDGDSTGDVDVDEVSSATDLAEALKDSNVLLALVDTRKVVEGNFRGIDSDDFRGKVGNADSEFEGSKINEIKKICESANPDKVIAIATKTDILIDKYKDEKGENEPHEGAGDFVKFTEFVNEFFTELKTFQDFKRNLDINTIHPVYYQTITEEGDENPVPVKNDGKLQPEGFERIVDEVVNPKR
jgi:hypothetical protein